MNFADLVGRGRERDCPLTAHAALPEIAKRRGHGLLINSAVSALRQVVTGVVSEKVMPLAAKRRVPQLERDIAALDGQEVGANSVGDRGRQR